MQARPATFWKKKANTSDFLVNFAKFLRTLILKNNCERLLLTCANNLFCGFFSQKKYVTLFSKVIPKAVTRRCFVKTVVQKLRPATLLKKETLAQVFSCEFWEVFKNPFFYKTPPIAASAIDLRRFAIWESGLKFNIEEYLRPCQISIMECF